MRSACRYLLLPTSVFVLAAAVGCQHHALVARQHALRQQNMRLVLDTIADSEQSRSDRFQRTWAAVERNTETDIQRIRHDPAWYGHFIEADNRRWEQRQPAYRAAIEQVLGGKPARIEPNAIILFY